jgi:hypothetical protein
MFSNLVYIYHNIRLCYWNLFYVFQFLHLSKIQFNTKVIVQDNPTVTLSLQIDLAGGFHVYLSDLYSFDLDTMAWSPLVMTDSTGIWPSSRAGHGFTSAGGKLYVHGGHGISNDVDGPGMSNLLS